MQVKSLEELEKDYMLGLNYIENSNNAKSLKNLYIKRLKEIREELINNKSNDEQQSRKNSK